MISSRLVVVAFLATLSTVAGAQENNRCGRRIPSSERQAYVGLPTGDLFCALLADPKAMRSFLSYQRTIGEDDSLFTIGSVGIADQFALARWGGASGNGVQLSISGAVFAQFDLSSESFDLLNADYIVGIPLTMRANNVSAQFRVYHQSSHLGDEFLLRGDTLVRENLSFESAEAIVSAELGALRVYGGGEYLFNRNPEALQEMVAHGGAELRRASPLINFGGAVGGVRPIAAIDVKAAEQQDWDPAISARVGLEFERTRGADPPSRRWSLMLEAYDGPSPYGQFFRQKIRYVGLGAHFQL